MQLAVTVDEMKNYLRVDFEDDDALIGDLIRQGQQICMDVARITDEDEFEDLQGTKIAVQYAAAYLYEHREEADHHQLVMDLRSLLFGCGRSESKRSKVFCHSLEKYYEGFAGNHHYLADAVSGKSAGRNCNRRINLYVGWSWKDGSRCHLHA